MAHEENVERTENNSEVFNDNIKLLFYRAEIEILPETSSGESSQRLFIESTIGLR